MWKYQTLRFADKAAWLALAAAFLVTNTEDTPFYDFGDLTAVEGGAYQRTADSGLVWTDTGYLILTATKTQLPAALAPYVIAFQLNPQIVLKTQSEGDAL